MRIGWALVTAAAMLAGCGGKTTTANTNTAAGAPDPYEAKIAALTPQQRDLTFYRAIYDADYQCAKVTNVADRPRDNGHKAWTVTCSDTGDFYLTLQPGGILTVSGTPSPRTRLPAGTKRLPPGTD